MKLSKRVMDIRPSATLSINAKAQELKKKGIKIISFAVGEPDFETPTNAKQMATQAILRNQTRYTPVAGIEELKEAVCAWISRHYGLRYDSTNVLVSCGGKHALYNVLQAIIDPGDEVIIPSPYWVSYPDMVLLCGGVPVMVPCSSAQGYKISPEALEGAITSKTRAIILNSPSNPTGVHYRREELRELAQVLSRYEDIVVISDDIYSSILFNGEEWVNIAMVDPSMRERTVIIHGVSKTYAMTGWRIGYAVGERVLINAASKIQSQSTSNPCAIAQWAALAALRGDDTEEREMARSFERRCRYVVARLRSIEGVSCVEPQGAFYVFPDVSSFYGRNTGKDDGKSIVDSVSLAEYLMDAAHIAVVPGVAFGNDRCVRLSYALSDQDLGEGLSRLETALRALR